MAETCIVCLGDLEVSTNDPPTYGPPADPDGATTESRVHLISNNADADDRVAHLLPCGHDLHHECLKPWVERANSCPICRANFYQVELKATLGGATLSSYAVQDKKQEAELDPSMVIEDDLLDEHIEPCQVCEDFGDEEQLLLCDGCSSSCHVFCAGLDEIPHGPWFCYNCIQDPRHMAESGRASSPGRQRTSARQRHVGHRRGNNVAWTRVWQSVWNRLHLDLDFPFDDEPDPAPERRTAIERAEVREWQSRFRVAQRQGGANRFRETAAVLLDSGANRRKSPDPESQEELRAWNAFDKALEIQREPSVNRRKRKSVTSSPAEPNTEPERKLKRPRTRRAQDQAESSGDAVAESSTAARNGEPLRISTAHSPRDRIDATNNGRTFLQSLLKEVETNPKEETKGSNHESPNAGPALEGASSPHHSSRAASPAASNHGTPNNATTPPLSPVRPSSPPPLSSTISPIYPQAPEYSPYSPAETELAVRRSRPLQRQHRERHHRSPRQRSPGGSPPGSTDASPSRAGMSYSTKSEIQKMVSSALKPLYQRQAVSKDEFTDINRDVSRKLYDLVGDASGIADAKERDRWARVATDEVESAVRALRDDDNGTDA